MLKIVSGAQTGVDRGALDAALERGVACGGWCPEGRTAEDGVIPERYPVRELPGGGYRERTLKNVQDSDATVIIGFGSLSGGTELTRRLCLAQGKPCLVMDGLVQTPAQAAENIGEFFAAVAGKTLNIAGPRASGEPRAYAYALAAVGDFIDIFRGSAGALDQRPDAAHDPSVS